MNKKLKDFHSILQRAEKRLLQKDVSEYHHGYIDGIKATRDVAEQLLGTAQTESATMTNKCEDVKNTLPLEKLIRLEYVTTTHRNTYVSSARGQLNADNIKSYEDRLKAYDTILHIIGKLKVIEYTMTPERVELPEIPVYIRDHLVFAKESLGLVTVVQTALSITDPAEKIFYWINNNLEVYVCAWLDGYTVTTG